jgi:hypothetical protein
MLAVLSQKGDKISILGIFQNTNLTNVAKSLYINQECNPDLFYIDPNKSDKPIDPKANFIFVSINDEIQVYQKIQKKIRGWTGSYVVNKWYLCDRLSAQVVDNMYEELDAANHYISELESQIIAYENKIQLLINKINIVEHEAGVVRTSLIESDKLSSNLISELRLFDASKLKTRQQRTKLLHQKPIKIFDDD